MCRAASRCSTPESNVTLYANWSLNRNSMEFSLDSKPTEEPDVGLDLSLVR